VTLVFGFFRFFQVFRDHKDNSHGFHFLDRVRSYVFINSAEKEFTTVHLPFDLLPPLAQRGLRA